MTWHSGAVVNGEGTAIRARSRTFLSCSQEGCAVRRIAESDGHDC
jgi:hypothetical protein